MMIRRIRFIPSLCQDGLSGSSKATTSATVELAPVRLSASGKGGAMFSWLVRLILIVAGSVAQWFVAIDSPSFGIVQGVVGILLIALIVFVLAFWPARWSRRLDRIGRDPAG
jgi:hypothetical protein